MAKKILTAADINANRDDWLDGWSDLYKGLNGFRPRWNPTDEELARFFNTYDDEFERVREEERQQLVALGELHDQEFANWSAYYDFMDSEGLRKEREYRQELEVRRAAEHARRLRITAALAEEAWDHGDKLAA